MLSNSVASTLQVFPKMPNPMHPLVAIFNSRGIKEIYHVDFFFKHAHVASALEDSKTPLYCKIFRKKKQFQTSLRIPSEGQAVWNQNVPFQITLFMKNGKASEKMYKVHIIQKSSVLFTTEIDVATFVNDSKEKKQAMFTQVELPLRLKNKKTDNLLIVKIRVMPKGAIAAEISALQIEEEQEKKPSQLPSFGTKVDIRKNFRTLSVESGQSKDDLLESKMSMERFRDVSAKASHDRDASIIIETKKLNQLNMGSNEDLGAASLVEKSSGQLEMKPTVKKERNYRFSKRVSGQLNSIFEDQVMKSPDENITGKKDMEPEPGTLEDNSSMFIPSSGIDHMSEANLQDLFQSADSNRRLSGLHMTEPQTRGRSRTDEFNDLFN